MSLGNDPSRVRDRSVESMYAAEAVAGARQARAELKRDGPAPTAEAILREQGRGPDGFPIEDGPDEFVPASVAARRALDRDE